jgi:hypothetical protein
MHPRAPPLLGTTTTTTTTTDATTTAMHPPRARSMVLLGTYDMAVRMMGDTQFLSLLVNFPKEQINDETVELLQPYFNALDFNFDAAKKVEVLSNSIWPPPARK